MADMEQPVALPKKKNNRNKRKKKDVVKNNDPKNNVKTTVNPSSAKGGGGLNEKGDTELVAKPGGSKNANSKKKNARPEDSHQRNIQAGKKMDSDNAKKANPPKVKRNDPPEQPAVMGESSKKMDNSRDYRNHRDKSYSQIDLQRRQIVPERKRKWHEYFLSKPHDLLLLDRNKVILLKTVEKNRPQAQFFCKVCHYYCDNMSVVAQHFRKTSHVRQLQDCMDETTMMEMPGMTRDQMGKLNEFLKKQVIANSMDPMNLETRRTIGVLVSELVSANLPGCSTRLFGSSIHGLGLKTSDVNIDLKVPEGSLPPEVLKKVAALLRESPHFVDVVENFQCEFPFISFKYIKSEENCSLSLNNERAVSLAILLTKYAPLDPRLIQLATLFRLWGQITQTDKAQEGTWPGYAFYLLTIFYLQRCRDPVLPVLNDFLPKTGDTENNTANALSLDIGEIKLRWSTKNKQTLAELWLGLLRFYAFEFNYMDYMVCIDSSAPKPRKTRKLFIVDPFLPTRNVARSISSNATFYYIMGCLMTTCKYFSMPQSKFGPLFKDIYTPAAKYDPELKAIFQNHDRINSNLLHLIMKLDSAFQQPRGDIQQCISEVMHLMHKYDFKNVDNIPISYLEKNCVPPRHLFGNMSVSPQDAHQMVSSFSPKLMEYFFISQNLTGGEKVPKICGVCKREGHLKDKCPEEKLPPLDPLPERSLEDMLVVGQLCHYIFDKWKQSDQDIHKREKICQELQDFIGDVHPTAKLELFGSTKNGFGLKGSDMDICLTFEDNKSGEGLDTRGFIEVLYRLLKTFKELQDLLPIATAKVPIVKFTHKTTKLDGDISLYNVLALENSKLLCTYTQIDERAKVLGCMMKRFSKVCHIGDASKGSLSSYAYTLLVIYFLQHCEPPVLPVLQELTENGGPPPKHMVEGCNAYFFSDLSKLEAVWPGRNKNQKSVGELWLDLLIFYTEQFDMLNNVICIRCSRTVTKFEKLWISNGIAIEDPFDLSHNLGSALTRKMYLYIIKALRKGRNHFARPVKVQFRDSRDVEAYFMNVKELTDGEPPNDRGCRVCKSIGHKERECPVKKKKKGQNNMKNKNKPQNETPNTKAAQSEDDEDEHDPYSDSEDGSSEQEDERELHRAPAKQILVKSGTNRDNAGNTGVVKPSPSRKQERQNVAKLTIPPGFKLPDPNRGTLPGTSVPSYSKTLNSMQRVVNHNVAASPITSQNGISVGSQAQGNSNKTAHIPTIVFNNSKLNAESVSNASNPVRYPFPPGQETTVAPPGFIPINQSPQVTRLPFPLDPSAQSQKGPCVVDPRIPYVPVIVQPNISMQPPPVRSSASSDSGLFLSPFGQKMLGMLCPAEQLTWGQSPDHPPPFPSPVHAALAYMRMTDNSNPQEQFVQNNLPRPENKIASAQNKSNPSTNTTELNNPL